jgi:hypothetical protein
MKKADSKNSAAQAGKNSPFFFKDSRRGFFGTSEEGIGFFSKNGYKGNVIQTGLETGKMNNVYERGADSMKDKVIQRKWEDSGHHENLIQRQEQPEPPETKPVSPDVNPPVPLGRKPRAAKCSLDPRFPDFGCYGQQLKLDIDENLFNNAHQFTRVATLFPGDNKLMLDTFLRYGIGKNLLETSFGFAGFDKKWSSRLSNATGVALKTYDLVNTGQLKLDLQLPIGDNLKLDIKLDLNTKPKTKDDETFNTVIGVSGNF